MFQFHFAHRRFVIRFWPALCCLAVIVLTLSAARWQIGRALYKESLDAAYVRQEALPAVDVGRLTDLQVDEFTRLVVVGRWRRDIAIFADNQVRDGRAGYMLHMPLCMKDGRCVLVARGWIGHGGRRDSLPEVPVSEGEVRLEAVARRGDPRYVELNADSLRGRVWQNVSIERVRSISGLDLAPFIAVQISDSDDGLRRDVARPDFGAPKHWLYAAQWFGFAGVTLVSGLYAAMKKTGEDS